LLFHKRGKRRRWRDCHNGGPTCQWEWITLPQSIPSTSAPRRQLSQHCISHFRSSVAKAKGGPAGLKSESIYPSIQSSGYGVIMIIIGRAQNPSIDHKKCLPRKKNKLQIESTPRS
jgi:hypothetical protein